MLGCVEEAGTGSPVAQCVPAGWLQRWAWRRAGREGARPEHSPSSEEKGAAVSIAPGKLSSIFRPSSMFGPGRAAGTCAGLETPLWASEPPGRAAHSWERPGEWQGAQEPQGRGRQEERGGRGGASPRAAPTDLTSLEVNALCTQASAPNRASSSLPRPHPVQSRRGFRAARVCPTSTAGALGRPPETQLSGGMG